MTVTAHEDFDSISLGSTSGTSLAGLTKGCFQELDATAAFFANFMLDANLEEVASGNLDAALLSLARSMYADCSFSMFDSTELLEAVNALLPKEYAKAVAGRWEAIRLYLSGNARIAISKLEEVLEYSEKGHLDRWFIDDVLIDLRNIYHEIEEFNSVNRFQQQLDERPSSIVYPQIDRQMSNLYECISDDKYKELTQSIGTVTIGNNATRFLDGVVQVFAIAACFGSLTHLSRIAKHMRNVLQYLSQKYDSVKLNISFVKLAIVSGRRGDGESALQTFSTTRFDCDEVSAMELFEFCAGYRCMSDSGIAVFEAFKMVGCYLSEPDYVSAQATFIKAAEEALTKQDPWEPKPRSVFDAIRPNKNRLPVDWVVGMCEKAVVSGRHFWVKQALRMAAFEGDYLLGASACSLAKLLDAITTILENPSDLVPSDLACDALAVFRRGGSPELQERIEYAVRLLPEPLQERCKRFSAEQVSDETLAILAGKQVEYLESANKTQGVDGLFSFGGDHAGMIVAYLAEMQELDLGLARRGLDALIDCLRLERQDYSSKLHAAKAIESLMMKFDLEEIDPKRSLVTLLDEPKTYLTAKHLGENETAFLLGVHMTSISVALGSGSDGDLISALARCYGEDLFTRANAGEALRLLLNPKYIEHNSPWVLSAIFSYAGSMAFSSHFQLNYRGLELMSDCLQSAELRDMASEILKSSYVGQVPRCKYIIIDSVPKIRAFNPSFAAEIEKMIERDNATVFADYLKKTP